MAGKWTVEDTTVPWALVEDMTMGSDADVEAVERLIVGTMLPISADAVFSVCAIEDCMVANGASVEVGPSSGSVDVDVFVRYNAVCKNSAGETQKIDALHFQTPKSGKSSSTDPSQVSNRATKVQPLGSSFVLTPMVCTPSGKSG